MTIFFRPQDPVSAVDRPLVLSWEGPFDISTELAVTSDLLISAGRAGCPYRMTSYRKDGNSSVDFIFGVHVHHPRFLEWVRLPSPCRPLVEWLQVMNRWDTLRYNCRGTLA